MHAGVVQLDPSRQVIVLLRNPKSAPEFPIEKALETFWGPASNYAQPAINAAKSDSQFLKATYWNYGGVH